VKARARHLRLTPWLLSLVACGSKALFRLVINTFFASYSDSKMKLVGKSHIAETGLAILASLIPRAYEPSTIECPPAPKITTVYLVESIYVSTYVQQNTTFGLNNYLTLTVNNAPTTVDEIVVGTSTSINVNSVADE
jgi:hypothetical protein